MEENIGTPLRKILLINIFLVRRLLVFSIQSSKNIYITVGTLIRVRWMFKANWSAGILYRVCWMFKAKANFPEASAKAKDTAILLY